MMQRRVYGSGLLQAKRFPSTCGILVNLTEAHLEDCMDTSTYYNGLWNDEECSYDHYKCILDDHKGHTIQKISELAALKKNEIIDLVNHVKNNYLIELRSRIQSSKESKKVTKQSITECSKRVSRRAAALRMQVEIIKNESINELKESQKYEVERKQEMEKYLSKELHGLNSLIRSIEKSITTNNDQEMIHLGISLENAIQNLQQAPPSYIEALEFSESEISRNKLEELFGQCKNRDIFVEVQAENEKITRVNVEKCITTLSTFKLHDAPVNCIGLRKDGTLWIGHASKKQVELGREGEIKKTVQVDSIVLDLGISKENDVIVVLKKRHRLLRVKSNGQKFDFIDCKPLYPNGIHVNLDGFAYVSVIDNDSTEVADDNNRYVIKYSSTGTGLQRFAKDNKGKHFFSLPRKLVVTPSNDVCVIDTTSLFTGRIVTITEDGDLKYIYSGREDLDLRIFNPTAIKCDSHNRVIVSDFDNCLLHLLNSDGELICLLNSREPEGIYGPCALGIDRNDCIWVGGFDGVITKIAALDRPKTPAVIKEKTVLSVKENAGQIVDHRQNITATKTEKEDISNTNEDTNKTQNGPTTTTEDGLKRESTVRDIELKAFKLSQMDNKSTKTTEASGNNKSNLEGKQKDNKSNEKFAFLRRQSTAVSLKERNQRDGTRKDLSSAKTKASISRSEKPLLTRIETKPKIVNKLSEKLLKDVSEIAAPNNPKSDNKENKSKDNTTPGQSDIQSKDKEKGKSEQPENVEKTSTVTKDTPNAKISAKEQERRKAILEEKKEVPSKEATSNVTLNIKETENTVSKEQGKEKKITMEKKSQSGKTPAVSTNKQIEKVKPKEDNKLKDKTNNTTDKSSIVKHQTDVVTIPSQPKNNSKQIDSKIDDAIPSTSKKLNVDGISTDKSKTQTESPKDRTLDDKKDQSNQILQKPAIMKRKDDGALVANKKHEQKKEEKEKDHTSDLTVKNKEKVEHRDKSKQETSGKSSKITKSSENNQTEETKTGSNNESNSSSDNQQKDTQKQKQDHDTKSSMPKNSRKSNEAAKSIQKDKPEGVENKIKDDTKRYKPSQSVEDSLKGRSDE
ncbi:unnamed protein product [Mytilus coruscus]|uniref:Uncharacterized protein n=1 Tax=Mytilus coruscus TaxID=42192 RepID=A0A6J8DZ04_MYTCO|nr:unnamed protein product [Mytilus coruscus]